MRRNSTDGRGAVVGGLSLFARAIDILKHKRAVMDAALLRMRLAETLAVRGEHAAAVMELAAAEAVFEAAGASGYLAKCRALRVRTGRNSG